MWILKYFVDKVTDLVSDLESLQRNVSSLNTLDAVTKKINNAWGTLGGTTKNLELYEVSLNRRGKIVTSGWPNTRRCTKSTWTHIIHVHLLKIWHVYPFNRLSACFVLFLLLQICIWIKTVLWNFYINFVYTQFWFFCWDTIFLRGCSHYS